MGKDSPDPPPAPDYAGAARATAAGDLEAAKFAAAANRVNQHTPTGNLVYQPLPGDRWAAIQTLSGPQQQILTGQENLSKGLLGTAQRGLSDVDRMLADTSLDEARLAQPGIQGQTVQDAIMGRLAPEMDRQQAALENQLTNQGIMRGSEAWNQASGQQARNRSDLEIQAALQGISTGQAARQQGISEQYMAQSRPLDIINALRSGSQVQNPQFVNVPQQATTGGPNLLNAAQAQYGAQMGNYNAQLGQQNAMTGGLFGLGAGLLGNPYIAGRLF